jgi:hypothetical protein
MLVGHFTIVSLFIDQMTLKGSNLQRDQIACRIKSKLRDAHLSNIRSLARSVRSGAGNSGLRASRTQSALAPDEQAAPVIRHGHSNGAGALRQLILERGGA